MVVVMKERATRGADRCGHRPAHRARAWTCTGRRAPRAPCWASSARSKVEKELIEILDGVHEVLRITRAVQARQPHVQARDTVVTIDDVRIGGDEVIVMAGPCSAETEEQVHATAAAVQAGRRQDPAGRRVQAAQLAVQLPGAGRSRACRCCARAADAHNLKLVSEVMDVSQIELIGRYCDIFQVGARNMQNYTLLRELGHARKPVLLKRGISATIEEWLLSAEYILAGGNNDVILCERGIRTFETATRNTFDISAIPVVKKLSHLPIVADPEPRRRTARHGGADGPRRRGRGRRRPDHRGAQRSRPRAQRRRAVDVPEQFERVMAELRIIAPAIGRSICVAPTPAMKDQ